MKLDLCDQNLGDRLSLDPVSTHIREVKIALQLEPSVNEVFVRLDQDRITAYLVLSQPFQLERFQAHIQKILPSELLPIIYIPVATLPLNSSGNIDSEALKSIAVIDDALRKQWEQLLQQQLEITSVGVTINEQAIQSQNLHISDLITDWKANPIDVQKEFAKSLDRPIYKNTESDQLAISHGVALRLAKDAPSTLLEAIQQAALRPTDYGLIYIDHNGTESRQSYSALLHDAQCLLTGLRKLGLKPQDQVILQLKDNPNVVVAFWGCVLGGFIPVPLSVASNYQEVNNNVKRLQYTWELLDKPVILSDQNLANDLGIMSKMLDLRDFRIVEIEKLIENIPDLNCHDCQPQDLAILLLTSGSTGVPKAVMQTHHSILRRSQATIQMNGFSHRDISLNWMPLDHVGGIVMFHIRDVCLGCQQIHAPTDFILSAPLRWLDLIESYQATITWAPNFAFGLVTNYADAINRRDWNLSSMRFVLNGGEAIVPKVARRFLQLLARCGLADTAMHPAWGMSETCSGVIYSDRFLYESTKDDDAFVEVGAPVPEFSIRIVNPQAELVTEGMIGIVQVQGAMVTSGYYRNPLANQEAFSADGWFNTGDLGWLREGRLTITGRQKDVIIINGANYYSHEIESVVEELNGIDISYTAAVGVRDGGDTDKVAIFFCPTIVDEVAIVSLINTIRSYVLQLSGVYPDYLIPLTSDAIPKTSIGKIQRSLLKSKFESGEFNDRIKHFDILAGNSNTIPNWFYRKVWCRKNLRIEVALNPSDRFLIFIDSLGLGELLCNVLEQSNRSWIKVEMGTEFTRFNPQHYAIAPNNPAHYHQLFESLAFENFANKSLTHILHLWTYDQSVGQISSIEALELAQDQGIYSLLFLVQALKQTHKERTSIKLQVISSQAQAVQSNEAIAYEKGTLLGLIKAISPETPWLKCAHIDLTTSSGIEVNRNSILAELTNSSSDIEIAYRHGQRWISRLEKIDFTQLTTQELPFKQGGTYLLTGGLGGIGVEIAKYLLNQYQARLLLVGRTHLPERNDWEFYLQQSSPVAEKIRIYLDLELLSGKVTYQAVDICDLIALQNVVNQSKSDWGSNLDGIIHLAGVYHEATLVEETPAQMAATLKPKVTGSWLLHQLLTDNPQGIFINFSSVAGFFSGVAIAAYASANSFLEAFSHYQRHQKGIKSYSFAWSTWEETGISRGYQMKELIRARGYRSMLVKQGLDSFIAALHHDQEQLLIGLDSSSLNIRRYLHNDPIELQHLTAFIKTPKTIPTSQLLTLSINDLYGVASHCQYVQLDEMPLNTTGAIDYDRLAARDKTYNHRKESILPRNAIDQQIARIWQEVLKIPQISIEDNFFELGGQSLTATQVISRIRDALRVELQLSNFFKVPTVSSLADALLRQSPHPEQLLKIAELRERLNQMSPEEIQDRLNAKK